MSTFTIDTSTSRATPTPVPGKRVTIVRVFYGPGGFATPDDIAPLVVLRVRRTTALLPYEAT